MGRSSVEATNVRRMCAVRAILCALLARLPLLAGLRRFVLLLAETFLLAAFALTLLCSLALLLAALVLLDVVVFFVLDVECFAAGLWSLEASGAIGKETMRHARTAAVHRIANGVNGCRREVALIISLYLYLWLLDA